ncbi:MAG: hypothetical protein COB02_07600 [Candidatus Cloacimonadota bacterium]|nr:MAG: hypothetical protein COB02_07600 [Candidatus Cloacimonadota bacterium]
MTISNKKSVLKYLSSQDLQVLSLDLQSLQTKYDNYIVISDEAVKKLLSVSLICTFFISFSLIFFRHQLIAIFILVIVFFCVFLLSRDSPMWLRTFLIDSNNLEKRIEKLQNECESAIYEIINGCKSISFKELLQEAAFKEIHLSSIMASLVQSKKIFEQIDIETGIYIYSIEPIELKSELTKEDFQEPLVNKIKIEQCLQQLEYLKGIITSKNERHEKISLTFASKTIILRSLGIALISMVCFLFSFSELGALLLGVSIFHWALLTALSGSEQEIIDSQKSEVKNFADPLLRQIDIKNLELESFIVQFIENSPNKSLKEISDLLKVETRHLSDTMKNLVTKRRIIEDIEIESGNSIYSICNDYILDSKEHEIKNDALTRYTSKL